VRQFCLSESGSALGMRIRIQPTKIKAIRIQNTGFNPINLVKRYFYLNMGLGILLDNLEGEELDVILNVLVAPVSANETLRVEDGVLRVRRQLILGRVTDQPSKQFKKLKPKTKCCTYF
jgi:hypothetical protein